MKKTLVLGASPNPERYANKAVIRLHAYGHDVVAIGKKNAFIGDIEIKKDKISIQNVDTITLYLNAENQREYYDYILELHPKRIIFNPGAENKELEKLSRENNIETIEACTLVLLSIGAF